MKLRLCLVGACKSGKSHFIGKLKDYIHHNYHSTIGVDFCTYKTKHHRVHIWDTSGSDSFKSITHNFVQNVNILLAVYKDKESFDWLKNYFKNEQIDHIKQIIFIYSGKKEKIKLDVEHYFIPCTYTKESVENCIDFVIKINQKTTKPCCYWF